MAGRQSTSRDKSRLAQSSRREPVRRSPRLNPDLQSLRTRTTQNFHKKDVSASHKQSPARSHSQISNVVRKHQRENLHLPNSKRRRVTRQAQPVPRNVCLDERQPSPLSVNVILETEEENLQQNKPTAPKTRAKRKADFDRDGDDTKDNRARGKKHCVGKETGGVCHENIAVTPPQIPKAAGQPSADKCQSDDEVIDNPVTHWVLKDYWPKNFTAMNQEQPNSRKRASSSSYSQSYKDGEVPKAHSRQAENNLAQNNVFMNIQQGSSLLNKDSKSLCEQLLGMSYPNPEYTAYPLSKFDEMWQRVQNHNETRLYRDITPLLVPSPEILYVCGQEDLKHLAEDLDVEWRQCKTLGGPKPKPDITIGLAGSVFSKEEIMKMKRYTSFERATLFGDHVYFPFLLCEAKCSDEGINKADRQNMHSSSIAVNSIVQLYKALDIETAAKLSGTILVFSVSHDSEQVKLFGHYAVIEGDTVEFYRYLFGAFRLDLDGRQNREKAYNFCRAVYEKFYPVHLKRIRDALARLKDPQSMSVPSSVTESESQTHDSSVVSSQDTAQFKKPDAPASKKQKGEVALLREQLASMELQLVQQRKDAEQQREQLSQMLKLQGDQIRLQNEQILELLKGQNQSGVKSV